MEVVCQVSRQHFDLGFRLGTSPVATTQQFAQNILLLPFLLAGLALNILALFHQGAAFAVALVAQTDACDGCRLFSLQNAKTKILLSFTKVRD